MVITVFFFSAFKQIFGLVIHLRAQNSGKAQPWHNVLVSSYLIIRAHSQAKGPYIHRTSNSNNHEELIVTLLR